MPEVGLDDEAKNTLEYYKVLKDYAKHEDTLMNFRITWCLGISSLMFTSIALLVSAFEKMPYIYVLEIGKLSALYPVVACISLLGLVVAKLSFKGVRAAEISLGSLNEIWAEHSKDLAFSDRLPRLLGGVRPQIAPPEVTGIVPSRQSAGKWERKISTAIVGYFDDGAEVAADGDHNFVARHYPIILLSTIYWSWIVIGLAALALGGASLVNFTPLSM